MGTINGKLVVKIALCGKMRSGKDTVANFLREKHKFTGFRFSEGIWETIRLLYRQVYAKRHEEKPRKLLQDIGQKMREVDPDVWVNYTFNKIEEVRANRVVVSDLRQPNEFNELKQQGFFIVRVSAEDRIRLNRILAENDNFDIQDLYHETERYIDGFKVDFEIQNNGTIEELLQQSQAAFDKAVQYVKGGKPGGRI
ncbi:AAA family ATPase [Bacillus sp. ISL-18]|uniref:AAA family ATPase n=1 Tax=Bacillus sp. ISL-18 TaxID=2819118 RepID=UPI001BE73FBA|nr:AAA family ATPase [Bacillus sp. ISL-18]MBT2654206.1 AAA family ATPase [Bacillus sp. ISL-18]